MNDKKISRIVQLTKRIAIPKVFIIISLSYLVAGALEDYSFWVAQQEMTSFIFGSIAQIIMLVLLLVAIIMIGETIMRKNVAWTKKLGHICMILCALVVIYYASYLINEYISFKAGGVTFFEYDCFTNHYNNV